MAKTMINCCVWLMMMVLALMLVRPGKAFDCFNAQKELIPCLSFLSNNNPKPSVECCSGVQDVGDEANSSKQNLRAACECLKSAAQFFPGINFDNAKKLPALCNANLNITLDPNIDCNKL